MGQVCAELISVRQALTIEFACRPLIDYFLLRDTHILSADRFRCPARVYVDIDQG